MTVDKETGEVTLNIYQRINLVQTKVREVRKVRQNEHFKYKFIGHDDVTAALRDEKALAGIVTTVSITSSERVGPLVRVDVQLEYINMDNPEDRFVTHSVGESYSTDKNEKPSDLQIGKALSYAVKIAELKLFQLIGDSTPDSEEGHASAPPVTQQAVEVTPAVMASLIALCDDVKSEADLQGVNREINNVIKFMTREQNLELSVAHGKAKARITQQGAGA